MIFKIYLYCLFPSCISSSISTKSTTYLSLGPLVIICFISGFLFTVLCGGTDQSNHQASLAEQWAAANGCPVEKIYNKDVDKLMWILGQEATYLVMKISESTPPHLKNFMMKFKMEGKHGTVVK